VSELAGVIIIPPPVIITNGAELHGPVPWWFWLVLAGAVALFLAPVGWMVYSDWKREKGGSRR
jgi:hypothetical protein